MKFVRKDICRHPLRSFWPSILLWRWLAHHWWQGCCCHLADIERLPRKTKLDASAFKPRKWKTTLTQKLFPGQKVKREKHGEAMMLSHLFLLTFWPVSILLWLSLLIFFMTFQTLCFLCFFMEIAGVVETDSKSLGLRLWGSFISGISVFALSIWESYLGAVIFVLVLSLGDPGKGWTSGFVCGLEWWDAQEICTMYDHECLIVVLRGNDTNSGVLVVAPHFRETLLLTFIRWKIWKTLWSEGHNLVTHPLWVLHHGSHWGKGLFHIFSHLFTSCHFQSWTKRAEGGNVLSDHNGSYVFGCSARGTYLRWGDTRWYHLIHLLVLWQSPGCKCSCDEFLYGKVGLWQLFALKMYLLRTEFQCVGRWQCWMWIYHSWDTETAPRSGARNSCGSSLEWQVEICDIVTLWYHIFHIFHIFCFLCCFCCFCCFLFSLVVSAYC